MSTPFVYLAHPIDFSTRGDSGQIAIEMNTSGLAAYIPGYAFKTPIDAERSPVINQINRAALTACAGLIAFLPSEGETSFGVPMEIEQARAENKPTLIVGTAEQFRTSWALQPTTDLVHFTTHLTPTGFRWLRGTIERTARQQNRPAATRALYTQLDPGAVLPTRAYDGDAGFDLYTLEDTVIEPGEFVDVPVGCRMQFPDGVWGMIFGRSSTVRKLDLLVTPGIIDTGYRGLLYAGVRSFRSDAYVVAKGERIAQIVPFPNVAQTLHATPVDVLTQSDRGESGFGSSGV